MRNFRINLGLNNNPQTLEQIERDCFNALGKHINLEVKVSKYNNKRELTLIVYGKTRKTYQQVFRFIDIMNSKCTQECIPFTYNNEFKDLVYNIEYKGQKQLFNEEYFI